MLKGLTFLRGAATVALMALAAPALAAPHANTVVASVNGEEITLGHMIMARENLPQQYKQLPDEVLYNAILDQLIQQTALKQQLNGEVPHYVQLSVENESRALLAADVIETVMANAAGEEALRAAYDRKYSTGNGGDEFHAAHILLETEEEAREIKEELDDGADFATMAKAHSTGPSGPSGGDLGWFGLGSMVPEFEEALLAMRSGQISNPVQTQFGWHVILLRERRKSAAPSFDEVRGELEQELRTRAVEDRVNDLTAAANIQRPEIEDLDVSIIKDLSLVRN
ncbi:peptidylprolyl isomerase [Phaeobacter sp. QD34_3]|uniref:peptidylprolyl isomerase n=1 Tax=unclassified Phaeobacter TaxID=2621772 RepID=UPI00237F5FFA|nr:MULTISPECIES: peptidylprolyl isomerase [unclassified Phaeobacter]MDE4134350.1 peptidylprolyl isomerase [Phaeobacter sp. QD34_3]MDE4137683.1 peptidylprolyl isomerase [Phaeobacter sp. QD34_24]MDE4172894.1 peptidylprolyl isomerase [Phaeobacter sp. PT47_59]